MKIYLAGIDEAGYGPLLGPLLLSASVWSVNTDENLPDKIPNLWKSLQKIVTKNTKDNHKIIIADSKLLHKPKKIIKLEETVLTTLLSLQENHKSNAITIENFIKRHAFQQDLTDIQKIPWFKNFDGELPAEANFDKCKLRSIRMCKETRKCGVKLENVTSRIITAVKFNQLIAKFNNKSHMHWDLTASIIKELAAKYNPLRIVIDKQGGRDFYSSLLKNSFPEFKVRTDFEGKIAQEKSEKKNSGVENSDKQHKISSYSLIGKEKEIMIAFVSEAEKYSLPVALSSCYAKYSREILMNQFNAYFQQMYPEIKGTRGYYTDGMRFITDLRKSGFEIEKIKKALIRNR